LATSSQILSFAKSFDKVYPNLTNLKKFNGFTIESENCSKEF